MSKNIGLDSGGLMKNMLSDYEAPPLDDALKDELEAFVTKRKEELPDAWY